MEASGLRAVRDGLQQDDPGMLARLKKGRMNTGRGSGFIILTTHCPQACSRFRFSGGVAGTQVVRWLLFFR